MKKLIFTQTIVAILFSTFLNVAFNTKKQDNISSFLEFGMVDACLSLDGRELENEETGTKNFEIQSMAAFNYIAEEGALEKAWEKTKGAGTKIAIIDSGIDINNPDFKDRIDDNSAYFHVTRDNSGYLIKDESFRSGYHITKEYYKDDQNCIEHFEQKKADGRDGWDDHGSYVAAVAAAGKNDFGVVGIAPESEILVIKYGFEVYSMAEAIDYAVSEGADVINISSATSYDFQFLQDAITEAYNKGVIVVAAAGNDTKSLSSTAAYPACHDHVINVGSLEKATNDSLAYYTNYGQELDVLAPGTVLVPTLHQSNSEKTIEYEEVRGTSYASPIVAGAACLWKSLNPVGSVDKFERDLKVSSVNKGHFYTQHLKETQTECGILSVDNLLDINNKTLKSVTVSLGEQYMNINETTYLDMKFEPMNTLDCEWYYEVDNPDIITIKGNVIIAKKKGTVNLTIYSGKNKYVNKIKIYVETYDKYRFTYYDGTTISFDLGEDQDIEDYLPKNTNGTNDGYNKVWYEWIKESNNTYVEGKKEEKVSTTYTLIYYDGTRQEVIVPEGGNIKDYLPKDIFWEYNGDETFNEKRLIEPETIIICASSGIVLVITLTIVLVIIFKKKK